VHGTIAACAAGARPWPAVVEPAAEVAVAVGDAVAVGLGVALVVGLALGDAVVVGLALDVALVVGLAFGVGGGGAVTVRAVAQSPPSGHVLPAGAAPVVRSVPSLAVSATVTRNEALASEPAVRAGTAHVTVPALASRVSLLPARSLAVDDTRALSRTPDRSSTTTAPSGRGLFPVAWRV
jgi:hypothetical protein